MQRSDVDDIDFKPFFDAVVGILFVLLILVSAQLFFTQWASVLEQESPAERARRITSEWERQIATFLEDLAQRLRARGLAPAVHALEHSVSLPLATLTTLDTGRWPVLERDPPQIVADVLLDRLRCLPGQTGLQAPDCPGIDMLRLRHADVDVDVVPPTGAALASDRYAEYVRLLLEAAVIRSAPGLLAVSGAAARTIRSRARTVASDSAIASDQLFGDLALRFTFEPPAVQ